MKLIDGLGGPGEVLGHGLPDWPGDLLTFKERSAYQRGVADARCVAKALAAPAPQPGSPAYAGPLVDRLRYWANNGNSPCAESARSAMLEAARLLETAPAPQTDCKVVDVGFRWDGESQCHVPKIVVEFEPVPAGSPCDAKGWGDRDRLAKALNDGIPYFSVSDRKPLTDEQLGEGWDQMGYPCKPFTAWRMGVRWGERAHGITAPEGKQP